MMKDWLPFRDTFLFEMLAVEAFSLDKSCFKCHDFHNSIYRCSNCFHPGVLCLKCCLETHAWHPFHRIKKWTGHYFATTTFRELGYILHLGHGGAPCPTLSDQGAESKGESTTVLTVVDIGHIHSHKASWCKCSDAPPKVVQLLKSHLFPGSIHSPRTGFTFRVMEYYHMDSNECNTPAQSFYTKLKRLTNRYHPHSVPVSSV